jgi:hypothetical protein
LAELVAKGGLIGTAALRLNRSLGKIAAEL